MDPNETLNELRKIVAEVNDTGLDSMRMKPADAALAMAELVDALDGWLSKGGFKPDAWSDRVNPAHVVATGNQHNHTKGWVAKRRGVCSQCDIEAELSHNYQKATYPDGTPYDNPVEN